VPITITRSGDLYSATVSPPHGNGKLWSSPQPTTALKLIDGLRELGCHTTDITDALYEADPSWLNRLKDRGSAITG
jgi:hypothetical protein